MITAFNFEVRAEYSNTIIAKAIIIATTRKDKVVGRRLRFFRNHLLLLPEGNVVFFSKILYFSLLPIIYFILNKIEILKPLSRDFIQKKIESVNKQIEPRTLIDPACHWARPIKNPSFDATGVTICIIDSGVDSSIDILANVADSFSFVDHAARIDYHGHGTKVASVVSGWRTQGQEEMPLACNARLLVAKVYGESTKDAHPPKELVEIAVAWAIEKHANLIVACIGSGREIHSPLSSFSTGVSKLLSSNPDVIMLAAAGVDKQKYKSIGIMEPACAKDVFAVASFNVTSSTFPTGGAENDDSRLSFSGPSIAPAVYARYPEDPKISAEIAFENLEDSSSACAYVSGVTAQYYQKLRNDGYTNLRNAVLREMSENCWRCDDWPETRGGFGIPFPPDGKAPRPCDPLLG